MMKKVFSTFLFLSICIVNSFAQTGSLDPSFGNGGLSVTSGFASCSVQQADGKIVVVSSEPNNKLRFYRFLPNGTFDLTFGTNGTTAVSEPTGPLWSTNIIVQPDGKIVASGYKYGSYQRIFVCRLNANGLVDSTFANNGKLIHSFLAINHIQNTIHNSIDGKLLITGLVDTSLKSLYYLKINLDGSIDSTFGVNGVVFVSGLGYSVSVPRTQIQTDGKIVTSFSSSYLGFNSISLLRLNTDGSFDNTFGTNGMVNLSMTHDITLWDNKIQSNGKVIVVGSVYLNLTQGAGFLARFLPNGSIDSSFGSNGIVIHGPGILKSFYKIELQPSDDKGVVFGYNYSPIDSMSNAYVARFNTDGTLDTEFGEPANAFLTNQNKDFVSGHIATDGGIIAVGNSILGSWPSAIPSRILAKYISCSNSITNQPQATTKEVGTSATFTANSSSIYATYQWQMMGTSDWENIINGGQYYGAQTATLNISNLALTNDGQQYRVISSSGVCVDTSNMAVLSVTPTNGIKTVHINKDLKIYPNPTKQNLVLDSKLPIQHIQIVDIIGRAILSLDSKNQTKLTLDLLSVTSGVYWLRITTVEGTSMHKIVKE